MSRVYTLLPAIILFILIFSSENIYYNNDNFFSDIGNSLNVEFIRDGDLYFIDRNSVIKKIEIEIAKKDSEKINGLKFRSSIKEDTGMLFLLRDQEEYKIINIKGVRKFLDIIYIDEYNTIIFIDKNVNPIKEMEIPDLYPSIVKYVLEINAGMAEKWKIKEGFRVNYFLDKKNI
ncbi:DUF192 domain-containing protein [Blattabacterium cuenoti]|uniref:DUF192 domain-containing protein n=1 Tax=Blattabacterium cuenoti TaxID=1653831 RepID=UPI00163BC3DB|nr:DUF192 domain-containing protein [Blattabacterium cuenoti]